MDASVAAPCVPRAGQRGVLGFGNPARPVAHNNRGDEGKKCSGTSDGPKANAMNVGIAEQESRNPKCAGKPQAYPQHNCSASTLLSYQRSQGF